MPTLRDWRIRRLWSQRELAQRAGVAEKTILNIETGQHLPRLLTMRRIADALGVPWEDIAEFRSSVAGLEEKAAA
jgi:transcriptional regulator with XRE-family HTH domain